MKSTQKFLCYSLALVGAALIFSAGCKKGDTVTVAGPVTSITTTVSQPVLNTGGPALTGTTSATVTAQDYVASMGSSSLTVVGFNYTVTAISWTGSPVATGSNSPTYTGSLTMTGPSTGVGAFSTGAMTLTIPATAFASGGALSGTIFGTNPDLVWKVRSFATNSVGTVYSAATQTINSND